MHCAQPSLANVRHLEHDVHIQGPEARWNKHTHTLSHTHTHTHTHIYMRTYTLSPSDRYTHPHPQTFTHSHDPCWKCRAVWWAGLSGLEWSGKLQCGTGAVRHCSAGGPAPALPPRTINTGLIKTRSGPCLTCLIACWFYRACKRSLGFCQPKCSDDIYSTYSIQSAVMTFILYKHTHTQQTMVISRCWDCGLIFLFIVMRQIILHSVFMQTSWCALGRWRPTTMPVHSAQV